MGRRKIESNMFIKGFVNTLIKYNSNWNAPGPTRPSLKRLDPVGLVYITKQARV